MTKRTIIIIIAAVALFAAAIVSLFIEKQTVVKDLNKYLNGDEKTEPGDLSQPGDEHSDGEPGDDNKNTDGEPGDDEKTE